MVSENNFPSGAGIASSASAFAALALAASSAAGLELERARAVAPGPARLRFGLSLHSGRICRMADGYRTMKIHIAVSIAGPDHWSLVDCIAIVSEAHKKTGSTEGHAIASTSPLQAARLADTPRRVELCRRAVLDRDFEALTAVVELDSDMMHAVMMTSTPALHYWMPASLDVMNVVRSWRAENVAACSTVDAGANVHVMCPEKDAGEITGRLRADTRA